MRITDKREIAKALSETLEWVFVSRVTPDDPWDIPEGTEFVHAITVSQETAERYLRERNGVVIPRELADRDQIPYFFNLPVKAGSRDPFAQEKVNA